MILTPPDTPFFLRNGNADTIAAKFLQRPAPAYRRELLPDSTGKTKVAYDFSDGISPDAPLVVLFHGLEGSSCSHYAVELMLAVRIRGWNCAVVHFRSCGGIANMAPVFYHLGDTAEIAFTLDTLAARYRGIYAVGVSLGGNALAKYLGERAKTRCRKSLPSSPHPSMQRRQADASTAASRGCSTRATSSAP